MDKRKIIDKFPKGLADVVNPLIYRNDDAPKVILGRLRELCERLIVHLYINPDTKIKGINPDIRTKGISNTLKDLEKLKVVPYDITPYLRFWYDLGSLGVHYQPSEEIIGPWSLHLESCRQAALIVFEWYIREFPPIERTENSIRNYKKDLKKILGISLPDVILPEQLNLYEFMNKNDILVLHGSPWVGKTSIASFLSNNLIDNGYNLLAFHENSIVSNLDLYKIKIGEGERQNLNSLAGVLNKIISSNLFNGEHFVIYLDDPFGHRRFKQFNPLTRLRIFKWLKLSQQEESLGKLKIIITTHTEFLNKALDSSTWDLGIISENIEILNKSNNQINLSLDKYTQKELVKIVNNTAKFFTCSWHNDLHICEFISSILQDTHGSFEALRDYCRSTKDLLDQGNHADKAFIYFQKNRSVKDLINNSNEEIQRFLCSVLIGESLIFLHREYAFQSTIDFMEICSVAGINNFYNISKENIEFSEWVTDDSAFTMSTSKVPTFKHPDIRSSVEEWAKNNASEIVSHIIEKLCRWNNDVIESNLASWESIHISLRFSQFLSQDIVDKIERHVFTRQKAHLDVRTIIWAITGNWYFIHKSKIEPNCMRFLKRVEKEIKEFIRPLIWDIADNWQELTSEPRSLMLKFVGKEKNNELIPYPSGDNIMTFLAAIFFNYTFIFNSASSGCDISNQCLEFLEHFVTKSLLKQLDKPVFSSRRGDVIYETPHVSYTGKEILNNLLSLAKHRGAIDDSSPISQEIRKLIEH